MSVKLFKPITPTQRFKSSPDFSVLTPRSELPSRPRKLTQSWSEKGGRNSYGRMTIRYRGGGHKRNYRVIDFAREKMGVPGSIVSIEYDPNRTAFIALVSYVDGDKRFIIATAQTKVGDKIISGEGADILPGHSLKLKEIPVGTLIHNIELYPTRGGTIARSAGVFAQLMAKEADYCQVKLPSGEIRLIHSECRATVGQVSNGDHENISIGKAGRSRWMGRRPHVRGVAMNPVDHPMGGGEGKASGGHPQSPWGVPSKGYKTRNNRRTDGFILKRRK